MKQRIVRILIALSLVLLLALARLWLGADGTPRNVHWQPPELHKPDFASMIPPLPQPDPADLNRFVATLERPLFSPSRRPPPPPPPPVVAAPPPPPDPLANVHLFGVFAGSEGTGGIIARVEGKPRRIYINEAIGAWTLKSIDKRNATLVRGDETRVLTLVHARGAVPVAPGAQAGVSAPTDAAGVPPIAAAPPTGAVQRPDVADLVRDRTALRNAARAKAGLPPLK